MDNDPSQYNQSEYGQNLTQYILHSFWDRWKTLQHDRTALQERIARRHRVQLNRPPRAHCIPLRASDTRLNPENVSCVLRTQYDDRRAHTVMLYGDELPPLLDLVTIHPGGEEWTRVARKLGTHENNLRYLMNRKFFRIRRVPLLGGKRGKPVPILEYDGYLDPCARSFLPPDPIWGGLYAFRSSALPEDFHQDVRREPLMSNSRWGMIFKGWMWRCPTCNELTDRLYYPMKVPNVEDYLKLAVTNFNIDLAPIPQPRFACKACHHISFTNRCNPQGWNEFVSYLTCGLLYGHEIEKPDWWHLRKTPYVSKPNAKPSARRKEICDYLVSTTLMEKEIAVETRLTKNTVSFYVSEVYKQYDVHSREDLRKRVKMLEKEKDAEKIDYPPLKIADAG